MDPNANLEEQLRLARKIQTAIDADGDSNTPVSEADVNRLTELVIALDEWIRRGGFLPAAWVRNAVAITASFAACFNTPDGHDFGPRAAWKTCRKCGAPK